MNAADYPLLLRPHLAERVWAGERLGESIGEAWDLSVHPNGPSRIANGPLQGATLADAVAARTADFGGPIDLLAKRLDCAQDLSVQVHPKEGDPKTESWVVLEAEPRAGVWRGFGAQVTQESARHAAENGTLPDLLEFVYLRGGDCVFVPSGTVHAIGAGLFLFELQQSADTTYRLFDWGRPRELHLDEGLACSDLGPAEPTPPPEALPDGALRLAACDHFVIDRWEGVETLVVDPGPRWRAFLLLKGHARIGGLDVNAGDTVLLPHAAGRQHLEPSEPVTLLRYGPPVRW